MRLRASTSSPTRFTIASRRRTSTRTVVLAASFAAGLRRPPAFAAGSGRATCTGEGAGGTAAGSGASDAVAAPGSAPLPWERIEQRVEIELVEIVGQGR